MKKSDIKTPPPYVINMRREKLLHRKNIEKISDSDLG
jgi:hypothetical protein